MPNPIRTHLLNVAGERLCCVQDGPAVAESALLQDTRAEDVRYCPACARAALAPIVRRGHARSVDQGNESDDDELLQAILSLTTTPPDDAAAVMRIICPALVDLAAYIGQVGGRHD